MSDIGIDIGSAFVTLAVFVSIAFIVLMNAKIKNEWEGKDD